MRKKQQAESQTYYLNWEIQKAAQMVVEKIMMVEPGENVLITCESASDERAQNALACAVACAGAYPIIMKIPPKGKVKKEPRPPVAAAMKSADVWIMNDFQLYQTKAWKEAMDSGVRQLTAAEMDVEMLLNCFGQVDYDRIVKLGNRLAELTTNASGMRITSPAGTDFVCSIDGRNCLVNGGIADHRGMSVMILGQASICALEHSMNGTMVFDGALYPPADIGYMQNPVTTTIRNGIMVDIPSSNRESTLFRNWMASFNDERMYWLAHISYGFNPGVLEPTGRIAEDERVFGCLTIGFGTQVPDLGAPGWHAKGHTDGVILNPSVYLDDVCIQKEGFYVEPILKKLCEEMQVPGY